MQIETSKRLFARAGRVIPGGVNSPARAFKAVGGDPLFIKSANGAYLIDEDDNQYIDLINSWGPMIFGHCFEPVEKAVRDALQNSTSFGAPTRQEIVMAELVVEMVPGIEKVRMVNSGTEATMSAIRLARGFTGKDKVIKFEGCYHGHGDSFLIAAGSGAVTMGTPDSPGVTKSTARDTLVVPFNDLSATKQMVDAHKGEIAALILEPVVGNMGCVLPKDDFLEGLRTLCDEEGILLIFDEVMTGFRLARGGAQELFAVQPDLTTLGKIIGGGMPVGAYGGKKDIMEFVSPEGPVYQAGTLSGNPVAMAAGIAMLRALNEDSGVYARIGASTKAIVEGISTSLQRLDLPYCINTVGSMYSLFFTYGPVDDFHGASTSNTDLFARYFKAMLEEGIYLAPSQFESLFVSASIGEKEISRIIDANDRALAQIHKNQ